LAKSEEKVGVEEKEVERGRPSTVILLCSRYSKCCLLIVAAVLLLCFEDL